MTRTDVNLNAPPRRDRWPASALLPMAILAAALMALGCRSKKREQPAARPAASDTSGGGGAAAGAEVPVAKPPVIIGSIHDVSWLEGAEKVAAARVGDGAVVAVGTQDVLHIDAGDGRELSRVSIPGTPQVLRFGDVDGDQRPELIAGYGMGVHSREAPMSLRVIDGDDWKSVRIIDLGPTTRAQIVAAAVGPGGELIVAHFTSKYQVALTKVDVAAGTAQRVQEARMVMGIDFVTRPGHIPSLALARMYGDAIGEPGKVQLMAETTSSLPSVRGARAVAWSPSDGALIVADGWDREYRAKAQALITRLSPAARDCSGCSGEEWTRQVLANVRGSSGFSSIELGDIDGDGRTDVVASGDGPAVAVPVDASGAVGARALGASPATDAAIIDLDGDGRTEVVIAGPEPGIWRPGEADREAPKPAKPAASGP